MDRTAQQRFRLVGSTIAGYFQHRCDRLFRWESVPSAVRGKAGIGWDVPTEKETRPGIGLLLRGGDVFELSALTALEDQYGAGAVYHSGVQEVGGRQQIVPTDMATFWALCERAEPPRFIAQLDIVLDSASERRFLARFGLDAGSVGFSSAKPDLIEIIRAEDGTRRLRIWDMKASQKARYDHFVQVAFYSLLLEHLIAERGVAGLSADTETGIVLARQGPEECDLGAYRMAVSDFLRHRAPELFGQDAASAHYHVAQSCQTCAHLATCEKQARSSDDLSRIAYMSSTSKRQLRDADIRTFRELAVLSDQSVREGLKQTTHDLGLNLERYIAGAQALADGVPRQFGVQTLKMPRYENIRVVISAEYDPVTDTCFALGLKTYEGFDEAKGAIRGREEVFVEAAPEREAELLRSFLEALNAILLPIEAANGGIADAPIEEEPGVRAALERHGDATRALQEHKAQHTRIPRDPSEPRRQQRTRLEQAEKEAKKAISQAKSQAAFERQRLQQSLHFYVYDSYDLLALRGLIERHLLNGDAALLAQIMTLARLFPPESVLPDTATFRTIPATIVVEVLRELVALPVAHLYDLRNVSEYMQPSKGGFSFKPLYGFGWDFSNQVAFERIHDLRRGEAIELGSRRYESEHLAAQIEMTVRNKLRATDSVIRALKEHHGPQLRLAKEPFRLHELGHDLIAPSFFQALEIFSMLESMVSELALKRQHVLPIEERVGRLVSISGLELEAENIDGSWWFVFDAAGRDAKISAGDLNIIMTPESRPEILTGASSMALFGKDRWRLEQYKVEILEFDLQATPPRVRLKPAKAEIFASEVLPNLPAVLDPIAIDFNTANLLKVLAAYQERPERYKHVLELLERCAIGGWAGMAGDRGALERELRALAAARGVDLGALLNTGQWRAWRGVFASPLSLVWGPPGTGKTHTIAHVLLGAVLAGRRRPLRVLVTAFTHHAIANVLGKLAATARHYGLGEGDLALYKMQKHPHESDQLLGPDVGVIEPKSLVGHFGASQGCVIVGATVWAVYAALLKEGAEQRFDLILIDEASQMKVADALIALATLGEQGHVILAGDDQQLPPIIQGQYPDQHAHLLSSIFAYVRHQMEESAALEPNIAERMLFQLEDNFRMNEPLTAYPRDILYGGRFFSQQPQSAMRLAAVPRTGLGAVFLQPAQPAVLCHYTPERHYAARNPLEARLIAELVDELSGILIDPRTGAVYTPEAFAERGVAVVAPHRAQNGLVRHYLRERGFDTPSRPLPLVDTVDKLQGQERDVVFVSYGVTDAEYAEAEAGFLLSKQRFNVAATRARHKLVVFCSEPVLQVVPADPEILSDSMMLKEFRAYCSDGSQLTAYALPGENSVTLSVRWRGFGAPDSLL